jgi:hypothetical protein
MKQILFSILFSTMLMLGFAQEKPEFPPEIGKEETTILLTPTYKDKITEYMSECFEKNYKGKFEAVEGKLGGKYNDVNAYRYSFFMITHENPGQWIGKERFPPTTDFKFGVTDRKTGKIYQQDSWSVNYKKGMRHYVEKLEKLRKENGGK